MTEHMVYGKQFGSVSDGTNVPANYTIDNAQLPLFAHDHSKICNRANWWLRDVVSSAYFADAGYAQILDRAFYNGASGEYTFTINGERSALKAGRRYLVQIIMHRSGSTATATSLPATTRRSPRRARWSGRISRSSRATRR